MALPSVHDLKEFRPKLVVDPRGELAAIELIGELAFRVERIFYIRKVSPGVRRGGHAHRLCNQILICQSGSVRVELFDGSQSRELHLQAGECVWILPGIFTTETFLDDGTVILVLCDRLYEEDDYIRSRAAFTKYRSDNQ